MGESNTLKRHLVEGGVTSSSGLGTCGVQQHTRAADSTRTRALSLSLSLSFYPSPSPLIAVASCAACRDSELRWYTTDDVSFAGVMLRHLNATPTDSLRWFSEYSKPIIHRDVYGAVSVAGKATWRDPGYEGLPETWGADNAATVEMLRGFASVSHSRFNLQPPPSALSPNDSSAASRTAASHVASAQNVQLSWPIAVFVVTASLL